MYIVRTATTLQPEGEQEHIFLKQECFEGGALSTPGLLVACRTQCVYTFGDVCCDGCMCVWRGPVCLCNVCVLGLRGTQ